MISHDHTTTCSTAENRQLAYSEYGDPDGIPVLFLHGTPGSGRLGELFDGDARKRGIHLVAPDRPGYGRSEPWPDRSVADAGTYLADVLDDAGVESAGVIGFSGGGAHALALAATRSDRVESVDLVAGTTPPSVAAETPTPQRVLSGLAGATPRLLGGLFRAQAWLAARRDPSFVLAQYTDDPESVPERVGEVVKEDFLDALADSRSGAVTEFENTAAAWGIALDDVRADVRVRHGDEDANVPLVNARGLHDRLPSAELHVLDGADHLGTLLGATPDALTVHAEEA
ncbi:alpha/beta fold hydrolase [Halolamina sediminis]|uniref:alpha/beta fold hydrolase n=1 Tax=Halolamina sediminis TaxID=1480675 RepID=UPI0006B687C2|nr:alpha/beta hydrolase [Halolamina sediminis]